MIANLFRIDKEYAGKPAAIASFAQYATRADGPAMWKSAGSRDIPLNSEEYIVRISLYIADTLSVVDMYYSRDLLIHTSQNISMKLCTNTYQMALKGLAPTLGFPKGP